MKIEISVKNKIAKRVDPNAFIVCGNSDYTIKFSFDEEWDGIEAKTARFYSNGEPEDVVFKGDECPVPVMERADGVFVGVFAGDLKTTTKAYIPCERCILCLGGKVKEPTPDVYAQLMQMINDGILKGETGEKGEKGDKGDKGDAGVIKFIPVASLPTENIDGSAIYLLPNEDSEEENRYSEYVYIDGKWEKLGEISVQVDHSEYVKFTDYASTDGRVAGLLAVNKSKGIGRANLSPTLEIVPAGKTDIPKKISPKPIKPSNLDYAVKVGITTNDEDWTDEDKAKACETIGAVDAIKTSEITGSWFLYGTDEIGNRKLYKVLAGVGANFIPIRDGCGGLDVPAPQKDSHATNRGYVDGKYAELLARIEALEAK